MLETVRKTIVKHNMLSLGGEVLVGVSGGADSIALLVVLLKLGGEFGLRVRAAHVNHGLRGEESERDEAFVREFCEKIGVELAVFRADVRGFATEKKIGIEEAARILRYELLTAACEKIAVGHNADDNAETVLMNLCRGAGLTGLGGIPPVNGKIIRPLLEVARAEIEEFLRAEKIAFLTDTSNASEDFTRNRVRNKILPLLEAEVNPNSKRLIAKTAKILRDDEDFFKTAARDAFEKCAEKIFSEKNQLVANCEQLVSLHPSIARRVIRLAIAEIRGEAGLSDISAAHIDAVLSLARGHSGREVHLPGAVVAKEYEKIIFAPPAQTPSDFRALPPPVCTKTFAYDKITLPLVLRTREKGDKIAFADANGKIFSKKLQDYFTDEKIPRSKRDEIPLIAHGDEILWILDEKNRTNAKFAPKNGEKTIQVSLGEQWAIQVSLF